MRCCRNKSIVLWKTEGRAIQERCKPLHTSSGDLQVGRIILFQGDQRNPKDYWQNGFHAQWDNARSRWVYHSWCISPNYIVHGQTKRLLDLHTCIVAYASLQLKAVPPNPRSLLSVSTEQWRCRPEICMRINRSTLWISMKGWNTVAHSCRIK